MLCDIVLKNKCIIIFYCNRFITGNKMNQRRRRANDFTDSLNTFQDSKTESETLYSMSQDSLDEIKSKNNYTSDDTTCNSKNSPILAGSSSKTFFINPSILSTSLSENQSVSDLNKCMNSFQVKKLCAKVDDNKENNNPQCSMKDNSVSDKLSNVSKNIIFNSNEKLKSNTTEDSKRDSNYNIHNVVLEQTPKITISQSATSCTNENKLACDVNCEEQSINTERKELEIILCLLDNKLNAMKENSQAQQILKHLSNKFVHSPKFTEKLLTVIEESINSNNDDIINTSAADLSRLTAEFRKMCKYIEDESPCLQASSPPYLQVSTPSCSQVSTSSIRNKCNITNCKIEKSCSLINMSTPIKPISGIDIIKKRFFNKISKNNSPVGNDNVINESSNSSFEYLEAQCKKLFPEEKVYSKPLRRSLSVPLLSMSEIHNICEQQMASLNISMGDKKHKEKTILSTQNLLDKYLFESPSIKKSKFNATKFKEFVNGATNINGDNLSYKEKSTAMTEKFDFSNMKPDKLTNDYVTLNPDELEKTLLQDIAEKRKRCLDTARLITEINADPEAMEAQKTLRLSPMFSANDELHSLSNDEAKFLQILMSCKDYQIYLEKQKSLFKLLRNSNSYSPIHNMKETKESDLRSKDIKENQDSEKQEANIKTTSSTKNAVLSPNVKSCNLYKSPLSNKQDKGKEEKGESSRPKLFVTPGKTPNKNCRRKKIYFPSPAKNTMEGHILKSPHAEGLYRLNYNTVISPVGMYIRGTDMKLLKNVHAKPDNLILTPVKKIIKTSPSKNSKQNTPLKSITKIQEQALKLNLSPKIEICKKQLLATKTPENDNVSKNHLLLPKVSYTLPLKVKTIKESKSPKQGTRVKKLLEAAQSKIVIRHQGRVNSIQKRKNSARDSIYEINYKPEDESVHIEQAAKKTNFIQNKK